ncbi:MAG: hypothetical protein NW208_05125 [Bryobacter sp.]|nr:hypothetical protein [Bryobacter sp.]
MNCTLALLFFFALWQTPEKAYQDALIRADQAVDSARKANDEGNFDKVKEKLTEVAVEVESVLATLEAMPKPAYKNGKNYKRAELQTRSLLRRVDAIVQDTGFEEREALKPIRERVNAVHEKLLLGVMSKKP